MPTKIVLSDKIFIQIKNIQLYNEQNPFVNNQTEDFKFKIVLMKIS